MTRYPSFKVPGVAPTLKSVTTFFGITALALGVMATGAVLGLAALDAWA
jgi:hypothetical protein